MSSATLTEGERRTRRSHATPSPAPPPVAAAAAGSTLRPWHFFLLSTIALAAVTAVTLRHLGAAALVLAVMTVGAAGYAAFMVFRTLHPLVDDAEGEHTVMLGGRTRAALERDKALTLRSIKELEFDYAMGKVADADFAEMRERLRARAVRLMKQLEGAAAYHVQIERDLDARLAATPQAQTPGQPSAAPSCAACGTANEGDARFCKMCGQPLATSA